MEELERKIEMLIENLENDQDYEMSDEMQELYNQIKEQIEIENDAFSNDEGKIKRLKKIEISFQEINKNYETPDNIQD